ncbi:UNVERIFIED_CONTAM: hypothetical protein Sangu_2289400 [Sesamum angustifolium]|uniref:Uncharacterized protein n=1 Tax=Sesamum angustifolium TaxID=2727405 RepID=A0AAW2L5S7_9LAMI
MANLHVRSNSLPSKSHPIVTDVEDQLCRLRSSEGTSTSATSVTANLASLRELHEGINNLIRMLSTQQALCHENSEKWTNKLLEESLGLVDLCGFARDVLSLTKGSVQDLQSSIRRNRAFLDEESDIKAIAMLKETEAFGFSVLNSVLILLSGEKGRSKKRSWSLLSKFTQSIRKSGKNMDIVAVQNVLKQLKTSEMAIQELEEELEAFFRSLVKTRVSLLNALNH